MSNPLTDAIVEAAIHVPEDLLESGAAAIVGSARWSPAARSALVGAIPAPHYLEHGDQNLRRMVPHAGAVWSRRGRRHTDGGHHGLGRAI